MHLQTFDYVLWVTTLFTQGTILIVMRVHELARLYPLFFAYTLYQLASDICLIFAERLSYDLYFFAYWAVAAGTILFLFALMDELFRLAFHNLRALRNLGTSVFRWGTGLLVLAVIVTVLSRSRTETFSSLGKMVMSGDRISRTMLCALAILLLLLSRQLRVRPQSFLFGVALGFVCYLSCRVLLETVALQHETVPTLVRRMNGFAYLFSCLLWLGYAQFGEALPKFTNILPPTTEETGEEPLLDSINSIVERLVTKK
jgi:hypothetical protein